MKVTQKNLGPVVGFIYLSAVVGTIAWIALEKVLANVGVSLDLSIGPLVLDLLVVGFSLFLNPGTALGFLGGIVWVRLA